MWNVKVCTTKYRKRLGANILTIIYVPASYYKLYDIKAPRFTWLLTTFDRNCVYSHRELCPYWDVSFCYCKYFTEISQLTTDSWTDVVCFKKHQEESVCCVKNAELAPTSIDFWQHCKWLIKPTTLRLLAPQVSQVNHFLVWWTLVRIRVNNFSSSKSCNTIKDTYSFRYNYAFFL
jgi:hypothetical protein